jgi:RNA polymerase sigma-32 factor
MAQHFDSDVFRYMAMVKQLPALDRDQELALALSWKNHGNMRAREALVRAHLRHVIAVALKYRRYGVPMTELIAEGNLGLLHALGKFEPERGYRLVTYAGHWIRAYVLNFILRSWSMVGGGSGALRSKLFFKLRRERVRILNLVGDSDRANEMLAEKLGLPREELEQMLRRLDTRDVSLDAPVAGDSATPLIDLMPARDRDQEEIAVGAETSRVACVAVRNAVAALDRRERYIVEHRLSADTEDQLALAEIARHLGVSRERARQLEARAKKKLRVRIKELEQESGFEFLDLGSAA